jgi:hypothetical protein
MSMDQVGRDVLAYVQMYIYRTIKHLKGTSNSIIITYIFIYFLRISAGAHREEPEGAHELRHREAQVRGDDGP